MRAVTIIGIPFAWAHLKLAGLALWPIGKMIVPKDQTTGTYILPSGWTPGVTNPGK